MEITGNLGGSRGVGPGQLPRTQDIICIEEDPEMGACLTQKITFKF